VFYNIALMGKETAIIARETIPPQGIEKLSSGRGMSREYHDAMSGNIYAPSGNNKKQKKRRIFHHRSDIFFAPNAEKLRSWW